MNQWIEEGFELHFGTAFRFAHQLEPVALVTAFVEVTTDNVHRILKYGLDKVHIGVDVLLGARLVSGCFLTNATKYMHVSTGEKRNQKF